MLSDNLRQSLYNKAIENLESMLETTPVDSPKVPKLIGFLTTYKTLLHTSQPRSTSGSSYDLGVGGCELI